MGRNRIGLTAQDGRPRRCVERVKINGRWIADAAALTDQNECAPDGGEHAQREYIDFEQPQCIQIILVPLNDRAPVHRGVFDRDKACELVAGDHKATAVLRQMTWKANEGGNDGEPELDPMGFGVESGRFKRFLTDDCAVPPCAISSDGVDGVGVDAKRKACVPECAARAPGDDRGRQRGAFTPVLCVDMLNDFFAALMLEIHINIRGFAALA